MLSLGAFGSDAFADELSLGDAAGAWPAEVALPELCLTSLRDASGERKDGAGDGFTLGPAAGFIKIRDADDGTWFGGILGRYRFAGILAVEGSITFYRDEFQDGDVVVTQYSVQVSAFIFPLPFGGRSLAQRGAGTLDLVDPCIWQYALVTAVELGLQATGRADREQSLSTRSDHWVLR